MNLAESLAPTSRPVADQSRPDVTPTPGETAAARPAARWIWPLLRVFFLLAAAVCAWYVADNWERWTGAGRYQATEDAFLTGDLTPLSAKVSGYVATVTVQDFAHIKQGEVLAQIDPADYQARLDQARANQTAAEAALSNIGSQRAIQRALIHQAEASIASAEADVTRSHLEAIRQRELLENRIAGTQQAVEQANANEKKTVAQLEFYRAGREQQKASLDSLDALEKQLGAQLTGAKAQVRLAEINLSDTQIRSPVDGMAGQRQVRPGQFVNVGTQIVTTMPLPNVWVIANYKETQMTNVRVGQPVRVTVDAFPDLVLEGRVESWSPGTGSTFALLAPDNATGNFTKVVQRIPVKIVLRPHPALGALARPGMSVEATIDAGEADPEEASRASAAPKPAEPR